METPNAQLGISFTTVAYLISSLFTHYGGCICIYALHRHLTRITAFVFSGASLAPEVTIPAEAASHAHNPHADSTHSSVAAQAAHRPCDESMASFG